MKHVWVMPKKKLLIRSSRKKSCFSSVTSLRCRPLGSWIRRRPCWSGVCCCYCRRFCCLILRRRRRRRHIAKKDRMGASDFSLPLLNSPELQRNKTRTDSVKKVCGGIRLSLGSLAKLRKIKTHLKVKPEAQGMPRSKKSSSKWKYCVTFPQIKSRTPKLCRAHQNYVWRMRSNLSIGRQFGGQKGKKKKNATSCQIVLALVLTGHKELKLCPVTSH